MPIKQINRLLLWLQNQSMPKNKIFSGKLGENIACNYLKNKGYQILARNFRTRWGELDIIATYKNKLIFIEVKTRKSADFGSPFEAVTSGKLHRLQRAALFFNSVHPELPQTLQIDVIGVILNQQNQITNIEHRENVTS